MPSSAASRALHDDAKGEGTCLAKGKKGKENKISIRSEVAISYHISPLSSFEELTSFSSCEKAKLFLEHYSLTFLKSAERKYNSPK